MTKAEFNIDKSKMLLMNRRRFSNLNSENSNIRIKNSTNKLEENFSQK